MKLINIFPVKSLLCKNIFAKKFFFNCAYGLDTQPDPEQYGNLSKVGPEP
jgi:hypothetical protein